MFSEDIKILEFKQYRKFDKSPFLIYVYVESFIKRIDGCKYNSKRSSTTKQVKIFLVVIQYLPYGHLMVLKISMMGIEVKIV